MASNRKYDIIIIGAGAAGMAAAVTAAETRPGARILVLEKKSEPGRKILATGNGRCNLSNLDCPGHEETETFFRRMGILTRTEEGRIYPYTEDARDVRDALAFRMRELGVKLITDAPVQQITRGSNGFRITWDDGSASAPQLLLACGGKAGPAFGTTGDGAKLARSLGHSVTRLAPALSAVETKEDLSAAAGVRQKVEITLYRSGQELFREKGELQITKYGISGIGVFNASRFLVIPEGKNLRNGFEGYEFRIDLAPDFVGTEVRAMIREDMKRMASHSGKHRTDRASWNPLHPFLRRQLAGLVWQQAGEDPETAAHLLKAWLLHPKGVKGWEFAQVTRGGVALTEVDPETMASKNVPGLFLAGEILDYDGPCGGFNLQHAWETGIRAGQAMASGPAMPAGTE